MFKNNKGFTLFEVMVATAIMAGAILVVAQTWTSNSSRVIKWRINNKAAILLESKMAEVEREYLNKFERIPEEDKGSFEDEKAFSWTMESQKFEMPDMSGLIKSLGDGDQTLLMLVDKMSEYFDESIKEVTVTVHYTKGKKKASYAATSFFVDYNKPLPIPSLGGLGQ